MRAFRVWCEALDESEEGESGERPIEATSAQDAAEQWGERFDWDSAEYRIAGGETFEVSVRDPNGELTRWEVSAEASVDYCASEVTP